MTQAELEALYGVKALVKPGRPAPQKPPRGGFSSTRALLRCLLAMPALARDLPVEWHAEGEEAAAVEALIGYLREQEVPPTPQVVTEQFMGTLHEAVLKQAGAEITQWGDDYDVEADFRGILERQRKALREQELRVLEAKGLKGMDEQERARYQRLRSGGMS